MKLIIAGSRHLTIEYTELRNILKEMLGNRFIELEEIISGGAPGIDRCGEKYAEFACIGLKRFPANWLKYGKAAGPLRNKEMAEYADALLLIWDGYSKGSANMKARMIGMKKPVFEVIKKCV